MTHVMTCWLKSSEGNWPWTASQASPLRKSKMSILPNSGNKRSAHCILHLTFIFFRRDPQLTSNVAEVLGDAATFHYLKQLESVKIKNNSSRNLKMIVWIANLGKSSMKIHWEKKHVGKATYSKALEETANVLCWQGQLDDLEKTLNLLDRMKPTINDSDDTSWVRAAFKAIPSPQTYKADFEVIIVNDGYQENRSQIIEVWDPKVADEG